MSTFTLVVLTFVGLSVLAFVAVRVGALAFDNWLDRRLMRAWDLDTETPIYEETVKATGYRPVVS